MQQGLQEQVKSMRCEMGELKQMLREALGRSTNGVSHPPELSPHGAASRRQAFPATQRMHPDTL